MALTLLNQLAGQMVKILAVDVNGETLKTACNNLTNSFKAQGSSRITKITPYVCVLSTSENVDKLFDEALKTFGDIDIFIANAGFAYYELISTPDWTHMEKIYRVNVFSSIYIIEKMQAIHGDRP